MKAKRIKLSRPELKRQRDLLARYLRFLPTLQLKQQLLQKQLLEAAARRDAALERMSEESSAVAAYAPLADLPLGIDLAQQSVPVHVKTKTVNVAGVKVPEFVGVDFVDNSYSMLGSPPFVDALVLRKRREAELAAECDVLKERWELIRREFVRVNQRLNLFDKVMIPQTQKAIHDIRIYLGDEQTAAVGRAKIAKGKQLLKRRKGRVVFGGGIE